MSFIANRMRQLGQMFPGFHGGNTKHDFHKDFGHPETLRFQDFYEMFMRNGMASAAVEQTILKTWEDFPEVWESGEPAESQIECDIRQRFSDLRVWQKLAEADRRAMVGGYSGVILRYADGMRFDQPVDTVPGGLDGIVELIPVWAGQLEVSEWHTDQQDLNYGKPKLFSFNESAVGETRGMSRAFQLHPDRVMIWSRDGTLHNHSALSSGFNDLIDMQKVSGAGGEGFWKNAKGAPILEVDKDVQIDTMARVMGVEPAELVDKMEDQVADWSKGFDSLLMLMGMEAKTLSITLPSPEHFHGVALMGFAASMSIPQKILTGSQTGERASVEDAIEWAQVNMARRINICKPMIQEFTNRLEAVAILPERDWFINWSDLTDSSPDQKVNRANIMSDINAKSGLELVYTTDEIRAVTDHSPIGVMKLEYEGDKDDG